MGLPFCTRGRVFRVGGGGVGHARSDQLAGGFAFVQAVSDR